MYSDMSNLTSAVAALKYWTARVLAISVLPTPVGPHNMKEMGLLGSFRPTLARLTAWQMAVTAGTCPITRLCIFASKSASCEASLLVSCMHHIRNQHTQQCEQMQSSKDVIEDQAVSNNLGSSRRSAAWLAELRTSIVKSAVLKMVV